MEDIDKGDKVWSENPKTGEKELKEVVHTFVNKTDELVHVFVDGEEIVATSEHPFYAPCKGWTEAIRLRAGDILVLQSGEYVIVEKVQHEILEVPIVVYNFEVKDFHTYYVGNGAVLVHNSCSMPKTQQPIVRPNVDRRGNIVPRRLYDFGNGRYIRDDIKGHSFPDGKTMGRHFNTSTGLHVFY